MKSEKGNRRKSQDEIKEDLSSKCKDADFIGSTQWPNTQNKNRGVYTH
jgi:hypothetical protein